MAPAAPAPYRSLAAFWAPGVRAAAAAGGAGAVALAAYVRAASPWVGTFDVAEFQTLARTGGIAHSGYPAAVLLVQAFGRLPFGTVAFRANLFSVACGAASVALLAFLGARLTRRPWLAAGAALAFGLSLTMWGQSSAAGVHTFSLALGLATLLLALRWLHAPSAGGALAVGAVWGAALTEHLTTLALAPPLAVALLLAAHARRLRASHLAAALLGLALGLGLFAYTLASDRPSQPMNYLQDTLDPADGAFAVAHPDAAQRLQRFAWLLSARQYLGAPWTGLHSLKARTLHLALSEAVNELPFATLPLALAGLALLLWRRDAPAALLGAWLAGDAACTLAGGSTLTGRWFFLPGAAVLALGLTALAAAAARRRPATGAAVVALALAMPFARLALPAPPAGLPARGTLGGIWNLWPREWSPFRHDRRYDAFGRAAMARLPAHAVVLASWDPAQTLRYFVYAEPLRRDVDVLYAAPGGARFDRLAAAAAAAGRPVFAAAVRDSLGRAGETAEDLPAVPGWALWRVRLPKP